MRALIQRCKSASVRVKDQTIGAIDQGLLILLGIGQDDNVQDMDWLLAKILKLRIFNDEAGLMNLSVDDIQGQILVVSQFTLHAQTKKGSRPSYIKAAAPELAQIQYESFVAKLKSQIGDSRVATGKFGAMMEVELINDGPVTIWIDTKNKE